MRGNGWTGGQYSLFRALLGVYAATEIVGALVVRRTWSDPAAEAITLGLFALLLVAVGGLTLGWFDRPAALVLAALWMFTASVQPSLDVAAVGLLLLAHACVPSAPYGSMAARARDDPGGDWRFPDALVASLWALTALAWAWFALTTPWQAAPVATRVAVVFGWVMVPLAALRSLRPWLWLASLAGVVAGFPAAGAGLVLWHLALVDPAWIARRTADGRDRLFYDGSCGLCHRTVRFLLAEDPDGRTFVYAPLASAAFADALPPAARASLPDSIVIIAADGRTRVRSDAALYASERLGGLWRVLGLAGRVVPGSWRDAVYDWVARHRRHWFRAPPDACPLVPPPLRARFLA